MNKKEILEKIEKLAKKGSKFESLMLTRALQRLDTEDFVNDDMFFYTADKKRLIYVLGDETEVDIPEGVEIIGELAVANKKNLRQVRLPNTLQKIERDAFSDCDRLKSIDFPESLEEIDAYAFGDCDGLKRVYFAKVPKHLSHKAFAECEQLHEISVPSNDVKSIRKSLHMLDGDTDFIVVGRESTSQGEKKKNNKDAKKAKETKENKAKTVENVNIKKEKTKKKDKDKNKGKDAKMNKETKPTCKTDNEKCCDKNLEKDRMQQNDKQNKDLNMHCENEKKEKLPEEVLAKTKTTEADREPKQVPESPNMKSAEEAPAPKNFEEATKTETEKDSNDLQ